MKIFKLDMSFLSEHLEIVVLEDAKMKTKSMVSGVLQCSYLAPLLFIAHVNDMNDQIKYCYILKYADGIKGYKFFHAILIFLLNKKYYLTRILLHPVPKIGN